MRRQGNLFVSGWVVPRFIGIEDLLLPNKHVLVPSPMKLKVNFQGLTTWGRFGDDGLELPGRVLFESYIFEVLHFILLQSSFNVVGKFFFSFRFSSSKEPSFAFGSITDL